MPKTKPINPFYLIAKNAAEYTDTLNKLIDGLGERSEDKRKLERVYHVVINLADRMNLPYNTPRTQEEKNTENYSKALVLDAEQSDIAFYKMHLLVLEGRLGDIISGRTANSGNYVLRKGRDIFNVIEANAKKLQRRKNF